MNAQAAGGDFNVAFAVLRDVVVGDAVEDGAGFRINIGVGKVDDGAGFAFADDRVGFDVFDGAERGKLSQLESCSVSARIWSTFRTVSLLIFSGVPTRPSLAVPFRSVRI